jgi:transcriptional regulator with XRE-family HTH domain
MNRSVMEGATGARNGEWTTAGVGTPLPVDRAVHGQGLYLWSAGGTGGSGAITDDLSSGLLMFRRGTNAGWHLTSEPSVVQSALAEIRRRSQLTWEQLARVFGVQRRSLHFWARGARPSSANVERILRVLAIVQYVDMGDAERTRTELLRPLRGGISAYELLCANRDDELPQLVRADREHKEPPSPQRRGRRPAPLSSAERDRRRGFAPTDLLDARHDAPRLLGRLLDAVPVPGVRV